MALAVWPNIGILRHLDALKTRSLRALGEVAVLEKNLREVEVLFGEAKSLCGYMGIRPEFLCVCFDCFVRPDRYKGWQSFMEGELNVI